MAAKNPSSASFSYSYGVWALGGGSVGSRGSITDLTVSGNRIYDLGGAPLGGGETSGGAGVFLASLEGAAPGLGAVVTLNTFDDLATGQHTLWPQPGVGVALLQDDDPGRIDAGARVAANSYSDLFVGVIIQTDDTAVSELNGSFSDVDVFATRIDGWGTVDEASLSPVNIRDDEPLVVPIVGFASRSYYPLNQTRRVEATGSDALNLCTDPATPCATIGWAVQRAFDGDTIQVGAGTYAESVTVDKAITLNGAGAGTPGPSRIAGVPAESILDASGLSVGFDVRSDDVVIDGFDILGDGSTWTGVKMFGGFDGVTVQNNLIHGMADQNPNSASFSYSYGVWGMGGGTAGSRAAITDLDILNNHIFGLGGASVQDGTSGGADVFLFSTAGASAGDGVTVTGNLLESLPDGYHTTYLAQPGVGISILQDDNAGESNSGARVTGNTFDDVSIGVAIETGSSTVSETNASFTDVDVYILNARTLATVDEPSLLPFATSTSPSLGLLFAPAPSIAYFADAQDAFDNSATAATVTIDGNLSGTGTGTATTVELDGVDLVIIQNGVEIFRGSPAAVSSIVIEGTAGDDTLTLDAALAPLLPLGGIVFNGGSGVDSINLAGGGLTTVGHTFTSNTDGWVDIDGSRFVTYTGLDPIIDALVAVNRVFTFAAGAEVVVFSDDGTPGDNFSFIDSSLGESVTFLHPSASLVVNLGSGDDTITLTELDALLAVDPEINGDDGSDRFNIAPSANYNVFVNGGDPVVAPGDELDVDLTGTVGASLSGLGASGNWTFSNRQGIFFTEIESLLDDPNLADLALAKSGGAGEAYPGDLLIFQVTVTNNGVASASGIEVTDVLPAELTCVCAETVSQGLFANSGGAGATLTWSGIALAAGESATLTYSATVALTATGSALNVASITAASPGDPDPSNNSASASLTFDRPTRFPAGVVVQAIAFFENPLGVVETLAGTHNYGLYRSVPGFLGTRWAAVGGGLPANLFVNDLMVTASGTAYMATAAYGALHTSTDGGRSWTAVDFGGPQLHTVHAMAESPVDGTIFISADDGQVWRLIGGVFWDFAGRLPGGASHTPWSLEADPTIAGRVYAGTFGDGVWAERRLRGQLDQGVWPCLSERRIHPRLRSGVRSRDPEHPLGRDGDWHLFLAGWRRDLDRCIRWSG